MPMPRILTLISLPHVLILVAFFALNGNSALAANEAKAGDNEKVNKDPASRKEMSNAEFAFKYLVAEIAGQRGDSALAGSLFLDLAKSTRDARLAERASRVAISSNNPKIAVQSVTLWTELAPEDSQAQQASAQMLIAMGKLDEAKVFLRKLLQTEDTRAGGFMFLSNLFSRVPDKSAVLATVTDLAKDYPNLAEAHFAMAHAAWTAKKSDLALTELDQAARLHPGWEMAAIMRAQILAADAPENAISELKAFVSSHPQANEARLALARLLVSMKRYADAKPELVNLMKYAGDNAEVTVVVGLLSMQAGEYADAEHYLKRALESKFKDPDQLYIYLGQVAAAQKKFTDAEQYFGRVEGERMLEAKVAQAQMLARRGDTDAAIRLLDDLQELNNEQLILVIQAQANLLNQAKRHDEAFALLEKATANLPNTPELVYDYAMSAERIGKVDISDKELRRLIQMKPDFVQAYNALGYSLADRNIKIDEAQSLIEKALALSPNDFYILDSMGWVKFRQGQYEQSLDYLRRAYSQQADPEIAAHIGEVLWTLGQRDEAIKNWNEALEKFPDNEVLTKVIKKFQSSNPK